MSKISLALGGALALAAIASMTSAQTKATAPAAAAAAPPIVQGPPIAGLCVLSVQEAVATSTVGQYVNTRMQQIVASVKAELAPEDTGISNDGKALEAARPTLDAATFQSRGQALQARVDALRQKADLRQREIQLTERKSFNRIAQELDPIARQLYQQHRCSVLIDKGSTMMTNPEMDITAQAVTALNARITQFTFDREHLDAASAAAAH
jgi:outer membrane protein